MRTRAFNDAGCPYCGRRLTLEGFNSAECLDAGILHLWHPAKNGELRPDGIVSGSARGVWWRCGRGHAWQISAYNRTGGADRGCPYCGDRKVRAGYNDLATTHPDIAAMWHPRMNKRLKPTGVQAVSGKPAWWRGECGHVYQMAVRDRARAKPGYCPYCSGRKRPERPIRLD